MYVCVVSSHWCFFFFKQKTAYEVRISDWSSDVCSSDLEVRGTALARASAQDAGYGIETEVAELDASLVAAAGDAATALEELARPLAALQRRLEAVVEDAPDWLDAQIGRAHV